MGVEQVNQDIYEISYSSLYSMFPLYIECLNREFSIVRYSALVIFGRCKYAAILGQRELEIEQR